MIEKVIEGTGIGKERKKMKEAEDEIETMIKKEVMTEKRSENDPRNRELGVR